ncbi:MAG TPA: S8 family serine peptidase [Methanothrix sp.]|jgi:subtilisin family serine protease|nr:S8 family serine peptidase [Methanothrix sp.]HPC89626.1 S8 family serine peptidase [Methanothrix sp.]HQE88207.1 S8 family serine peptidase [Methanothrix sp.]HRT17448.1 S8 family serine peptidase [Methanothrix sp.]
MAIKQVMVFVDESNKDRRSQAEAAVSRVLAAYPGSILAEVNEVQAKNLTDQGFSLEPVASSVIKLRSIEFDPAVEVPVGPKALSLHDAELVPTEENYWIVQFVGPAKQEWIDAIQELGGTIGDYVPDNAFMVRMSPKTKDQVSRLDFIRYIGLYQPAYKISPLLMGVRGKVGLADLANAAISPGAFKPSLFGNLRVLLHKAGDAAEIQRQVESLGGSVLSVEKGALRISLDPTRIAALAVLPGVQWIEPYVVPKLMNDVASGIIGVQPVWNHHGLDGEGQIVAVADTGLDSGINDATMHDDFEGRIVTIRSWVIPASLHSFLDNASWDDGAADLESGHGTHVAGSVLGNGTRSGGGIRGMAYNARLVFQAVEQYLNVKPAYEWQLADGYYLVGIPDDLNDLFLQSYNDGARIFSNSWGGCEDGSGNLIYGQYTAESQDIDEFSWNHKDALILFAAGNDGRDGNSNGVIDSDSLSVQAAAKNCITVGASENNRPSGSVPAPGYDIPYGTGSWLADFPALPISADHVSDDPEGMAAFSSRGPTDDGRIKPDVVAPGTNILSVRSSLASEHGWGLLPAGDARRNFYMFMGGTSMATPITAGTVALIRQYLQSACLIASPPAALIKAILIHGAMPMAGQYAPPEVGAVPNNDEGWGRVNLALSLFPAYPSKLEFYASAADAVGTGDQRDYAFAVVNAAVPFRATLVWTDYQSTPAAGGLVNQLRLSVIAPDGTTTQGNPANNNVQQVVLNTPQIGSYTVRVTGINVPTAAMPGVNQKQDFALAVTAGLDFVDVYIKDNSADDGIPPSTGCLYRSPDIWTNLVGDPTLPPAPNPEYGQTNYVFVRVHNRGSKAADNATVKLYWANPGTNLTKPHWKTDGIMVDGVVGNSRKITVPARGAVDGEAITAFEWIPPSPTENPVEPGHFCLFATVSHPEDPILQEDVDKVRWEDNLAWKNEIVKDMLPDSTTSAEFYFAGIAGPSIGALYIDCSSAPAGGEVRLKVPSRYLEGEVSAGLNRVWESEGGMVSQVSMLTGNTASITKIKLKSKENTLVRVEVKLPAGARPGEVYPVMIEQRVNGQTTGRVSLVARTVGTPAYIANSNPESLELHLPTCKWAKKISGRHKVPYDDLELALRRGYNGCRYCLPQYNKG